MREAGAGLTAWCWRWGPMWAVMALIFGLSSQPDLPAPPGGLADTHAHFLAYFTLASAAVRGFAGARWGGVTRRAVIAGVLVAALYGVTDEWHQRFVPGRDASVTDWMADALGAVTAGIGAYAWSIIGASRRTGGTPPPRRSPGDSSSFR